MLYDQILLGRAASPLMGEQNPSKGREVLIKGWRPPSPIPRAQGYVLYEGESLFTGQAGADIVAIITGFIEPSRNAKTGRLFLQTYILVKNTSPHQAMLQGLDVAICGYCPHRGYVVESWHRRRKKGGGLTKKKYSKVKVGGRSCYVNISKSITNVWSAYQNGSYPKLDYGQIGPLMASVGSHGVGVRIGTYGDPVAVPGSVWVDMLRPAFDAKGKVYSRTVPRWSGYTHQWHRSLAQDYKQYLMASVDTAAERKLAASWGWKTFRISKKDEPLDPNVEIWCPADKTKEFPEEIKVTCDGCGRCAGAAMVGARSIWIPAHGPGARFHEAIPGVVTPEGGLVPPLQLNPGHPHPRLRYPVSRERIEGELERLYHQGGFPGEPHVSWPHSLTRLHERQPRRYAQVHVPPGPPEFAGRGLPRFEFAEQTRWLPRPHRLGLEAHEVGHALHPDGSEAAADRAAREVLGVDITYDKRWPGKGLQRGRRIPAGTNPSELGLPPLVEQSNVVDFLRQTEAQAASLLSRGQEAVRLAQELRFSALARIFGGPSEVHHRLRNPTLRELIVVKSADPKAHFWIQRTGQRHLVGKPFRRTDPDFLEMETEEEWRAREPLGVWKPKRVARQGLDPRNHLGVTVLRPDLLLPDYLYYVAEYAWRAQVYKRLCHGTIQQHIRINDVYCALGAVLSGA